MKDYLNPEYVYERVSSRLKDEIKYYEGGVMPERLVIAWRAYLAGVAEWSVMEMPRYFELRELLPEVEDDPVLQILDGHDVDDPLPPWKLPPKVE